MVRRSLRRGLWLVLLVSLSITNWRGKESKCCSLLARLRRLRGSPSNIFRIGLGRTAGTCFQAIRDFTGAVNCPEPILCTMLAAIPANALLA